MFPRGLCPDRDWCCVNSARAVASALFDTSSPYQGIVPEGTCTISFIIPNNLIIDEKWAQSLEHQLLYQTVQVNVDIGNYVVLGLLCTLFKLIWEAIAGDTSLITPPPPRVGSNPGFKPATQHVHWTSHGVMWWTKTIIYPIALHFDVIIATQILTGWRDEHFFLYQANSTQIDQTSGGR